MEMREARDFCRKAAFGNPKYRWRIYTTMQDGTINPSIERAVLEIARYFPKGGGKGDDVADVVRGMTILLRKQLNEDPLEPKKVGESSTVIEHPPQEAPALPPRASIVPPARPSKKIRGTGTLKPGEEELS